MAAASHQDPGLSTLLLCHRQQPTSTLPGWPGDGARQGKTHFASLGHSPALPSQWPHLGAKESGKVSVNCRLLLL